MRLAENRSAERSRNWDRAKAAEGRISRFAERLEALKEGMEQRASTSSGGDRAAAGPDSEIEAQIESRSETMEARLRQDLGRRDDSRLGELGDGHEKGVSGRMAPIEAELARERGLSAS